MDPGRFLPLGTGRLGRSDSREALRRFFEIDEGHVVAATLAALAADGGWIRGRSRTPSNVMESTPTTRWRPHSGSRLDESPGSLNRGAVASSTLMLMGPAGRSRKKPAQVI